MNRQKGIVQAYLLYGIVAVFLICGVLGYLLKSSYKENGKLQSDVSEAVEAVKSKDKFIADLQSERRQVEVITLDNIVEKEVVEVQVEKVVYKIQEVIKNAPPTSCLVQPIDPIILDCLRDLSCDEAGDPEGLSSGIPDGRLSIAWDKAEDLR